jgi:hypothetical protein
VAAAALGVAAAAPPREKATLLALGRAAAAPPPRTPLRKVPSRAALAAAQPRKKATLLQERRTPRTKTPPSRQIVQLRLSWQEA